MATATLTATAFEVPARLKLSAPPAPPTSIPTLTTSTSKSTLPASASASLSTSSAPPKTSFLSLPIELRLIIYSHLLCLPSSANPSSTSATSYYHKLTTSSSSSSEPDPGVHASILRTCRKINYEATHLLYSTNIFVAHPALLASFPRLRPSYPPLREAKALVPFIRRFFIQVRLDCEVRYDTDAVAQAFSGLGELVVDVVQTTFMGAGYENLTKFEGVRGVEKVSITGSTAGFEDYVAWLVMVMQSPLGSQHPPFAPLTESPWSELWEANSSFLGGCLKD